MIFLYFNDSVILFTLKLNVNNFTDAGRGQVEVIILDPKGNRNTVPCRVRKTEDNVYRCEYVAQTTGMHSVNVFFAGQQIPKSPFGVKVTPGKTICFLYSFTFSNVIC